MQQGYYQNHQREEDAALVLDEAVFPSSVILGGAGQLKSSIRPLY